MNNGDKPITPLSYKGFPSLETVLQDKNDLIGITKREYIATHALQGLLSIYDSEHARVVPNTDNIQYMAELSVKAADILLEELNKSKT